MEGLQITLDVARFLVVFFGLPVALLVLPAVVVGRLALRALRGPDDEQARDDDLGDGEGDAGGRPIDPMAAAWVLPIRRERDLAGWWFTTISLLPVLLYNASLALPVWVDVVMAPFSDVDAPSGRALMFLLATSLLPLLGAYAAGARLGLCIVRCETRWWEALYRGAGVALAALLLLSIVVYFDALTADYTLALENSPDRGLAHANSVVGLLSVPVLLVGALAGWSLQHLALRWTIARPGRRSRRPRYL